MIEAPGIYPNLSMRDYLAIPAVSAGLIRTIVERCAAAAWHDSYLNPERVIDASRATDIGSVAHSIFLEGKRDLMVPIDPRDHPAEKTGAIPDGWTNKSIRAARDAVRADGRIPMLIDDAQRIERMLTAAHDYLWHAAAHEPDVAGLLLDPRAGDVELTMVWDEGGTLCKLRTDKISSDRRLVVDYKTTATSVEPAAWGRRQLFGMGYHISAAWYRRGIRALTGAEAAYVFFAQEVEPPHLCAMVAPDPAALALGDEQVETGLRTWQQCVASQKFPGYPTRVAWIEPPAWQVAQWQQSQIDDGAVFLS